jgi:hypothetical protein
VKLYDYKKLMNSIGTKLLLLLFTKAILISVISCGALIAPYNETAYENATKLKVESLALMDKATEPYSEHQQEVEELMIKIDQAYEFSKGLPKNELSTKQWQILMDPDRNLFGGFIKMWKEKSTLSQPFVDNMKRQVSKGYDQIIELESAKIG